MCEMKPKIMFPPGIAVDSFIELSAKPPRVQADNIRASVQIQVLSSPRIIKEYADLYGDKALELARELRDSIAELSK